VLGLPSPRQDADQGTAFGQLRSLAAGGRNRRCAVRQRGKPHPLSSSSRCRSRTCGR
jgi:hypothetical protein